MNVSLVVFVLVRVVLVVVVVEIFNFDTVGIR